LFGRAAAIVALAAQLLLAIAGLGEGKAGIGYATHLDPGGTSSHYVHDDALCAACQARSLHGVARLPHPPAVATLPRQAAPISRLASYVDSSVDHQNLSRAPPAVVS
jgi:hypothetical protein